MNGAVDISWLALGLGFVLVAFPLAIQLGFGLGKIGSLFVSIIRMGVQLFLVGLLLGYVFERDSAVLNLAWFLVMVAVAAGTVIRKSELRLRTLLAPSFVSLLTSSSLILLYFTGVILQLENVIEARYFIALGGMLMGNSLRANIVGVTTFFSGTRRDEERYLYRLAAGATRLEALLPNLQTALKQALSPTIATMATMGVVFLPGMMSGQIIGGSDPLVAVKYQIAIMLAILASVAFSTLLCLLLTLRAGFDPAGLLRREIFQE